MLRSADEEVETESPALAAALVRRYSADATGSSRLVVHVGRGCGGEGENVEMGTNGESTAE